MRLELFGTGNTTARVRVNPDNLEPALLAVSQQVGCSLGGDAELGVCTRRDVVVVASSDAGVDTQTESASVLALGEAVDGVAGSGGDRQFGVGGGQRNDVVEIPPGWVDGSVV